ncbi:MAG TPA: alpha/beta fold hydrolase [Vicinamibacterales bacterium]|nr:alpha/beta fold hydrolase [Vicinamibacterales bacterium]
MTTVCVTCVAVLLLAAPVHAAGRPVTIVAPDGTTLAGMFYEASPRPAPAVVLVHMLGRSNAEWSVVAERLEDAGIASLALDLRGHGRSGGNPAELPAMATDVRTGLDWLAAHPSVWPGALGVVGASLGANLAGMAAADFPAVRAIAMISPSLDYRGLRLDAGVMRKLGDRPLWLAASTEDPYALRTIKELSQEGTRGEQRLSGVRGHGTSLLWADQDLSRALVDWLRRTLIF